MHPEWNGERLETFVYNEATIEHLHRYAMALELAKDKTVLDIACGEGYGSSFLADVARSVTGIDIDEPTVKKAKDKYRKTNLIFKTGDIAHLQEASESFDLVLSFETLEHVKEQDAMLAEIKR